jgi:hypothetical protein
MSDENQENEALKGPGIFTISASLTVPGYGCLIALNRDWCFEGDDSSRTRRRQVRRSVSKVFDDF